MTSYPVGTRARSHPAAGISSAARRQVIRMPRDQLSKSLRIRSPSQSACRVSPCSRTSRAGKRAVDRIVAALKYANPAASPSSSRFCPSPTSRQAPDPGGTASIPPHPSTPKSRPISPGRPQAHSHGPARRRASGRHPNRQRKPLPWGLSQKSVCL